MSVFKHLYNLLTVTLLCSAFIGQSLASTVMSYEMLSNSVPNKVKNSGSSTRKMKHCMKNIADVSLANGVITNEKTMSKCCADTCQCLMAGCANTAILVQLTPGIITTEHAIKIQRATELFFNQVPSSLYRPPIITA